jgi:putative ABC transport system permease protein
VDDRAAWQAVASGEALLAPPWYFDSGGLTVGRTLVIEGRGEYVVAGKVPDARRGDIFLAYDDVRGMGFPQTATVLVRVREGADASALAHRLTEEYQATGLVFESVAEEVQEASDVLQATVLVLQSFLFLGVFVGVSSTGFLAARAVHERRREIGTLRSLGYEARDVGHAFLLESTLVGAIGLVLGIVVGLAVAHSIWWRSVRDFGGDFILPWGVLAAFAVAVLGLTAWASWNPTRRAARLDPAEALRYVE